MFKMGQEKDSPVYFQSRERHPDGYSYYNRVYNGDGAGIISHENNPREQTIQEKYPQTDPDHNEHEHIVNAPHFEDGGSQYQHLPSVPSYSTNHIDSNKRDQFMAQPDVSQYYDFHANSEQEQSQSYQASSSDSYYSDDKQFQVPIFSSQSTSSRPKAHVERNSYTDDLDYNAEYIDAKFYDDYDDYGMELEFENELRRLEVEAEVNFHERPVFSGGERLQGVPLEEHYNQRDDSVYIDIDARDNETGLVFHYDTDSY